MFNDVMQGRAPLVQFIINESTHNMGYYFAGNIYLDWATLVKTIPMSYRKKIKLFVKCQEAAIKDVERAFGMLKSRFAIIYGPSCN